MESSGLQGAAWVPAACRYAGRVHGTASWPAPEFASSFQKTAFILGIYSFYSLREPPRFVAGYFSPFNWAGDVGVFAAKNRARATCFLWGGMANKLLLFVVNAQNPEFLTKQ